VHSLMLNMWLENFRGWIKNVREDKFGAGHAATYTDACFEYVTRTVAR